MLPQQFIGVVTNRKISCKHTFNTAQICENILEIEVEIF